MICGFYVIFLYTYNSSIIIGRTQRKLFESGIQAMVIIKAYNVLYSLFVEISKIKALFRACIICNKSV